MSNYGAEMSAVIRAYPNLVRERDIAQCFEEVCRHRRYAVLDDEGLDGVEAQWAS